MNRFSFVRRICALIPFAVVAACGLSDPEVPRGFYFDPPNELIKGDPAATWAAHQYVTRLTPDGFDTGNTTRYTGEPLLYYRNIAWNPRDQVIYAYKVNYKPGQTWLMSVSVPGFDDEAVARIPEHPRDFSFSPLFAFDDKRNQLVVADAQSPCGGKVTNIWYVYDVDSGEWSQNTLDRYAFTTLNYDRKEDTYVGVGFKFGEGRVVARLDGSGNVLSQVEANLCDVLEPRIHGYDQIHYQSQIVDGVVHIYRHVYFGQDAKDGVFWERQRYLVDIDTGDVSRDQTAQADLRNTNYLNF